MKTETLTAPPRALALMVIIFSLMIFVPLVVLGGAIDWPASLDNSPDVLLPLLLENEAAVRWGYLSYLAYSVLFLAVAVVVTRWLHPGGAGSHILVPVAIGLATASAACRAIGIVRWPSTMFPLAERWEEANEAERVVLAAQFESVNDFGGAIGELLGVSVFAALWLGVALWGARPPRLRWLVGAGWVVALLLLGPAVELVGIDSGPLGIAATTAINIWLLGVGVVMWLDPRGPGTDRPALP
ncbi:MAG: DUF4386 family protein [Ornithinimicrobium sp.]